MEVKMASTDVSSESPSGTAGALGVDMNLEVVTLPVSDVDRAKSFYQSLGWRLDIDLVVSDDIRTVPQHLAADRPAREPPAPAAARP
jgi:predicted enzyme related to lactoylglutathione lyase